VCPFTVFVVGPV